MNKNKIKYQLGDFVFTWENSILQSANIMYARFNTKSFVASNFCSTTVIHFHLCAFLRHLSHIIISAAAQRT